MNIENEDYERVLNFCKVVRESFAQAEIVYTTGSCYKFFEMIEASFLHLNPIPYFNVDHVVTRIGDKYFDITGEVDKGTHQPLEEEPRCLEFYKGVNRFDLGEISRIPTWYSKLLESLNPKERDNHVKALIDTYGKYYLKYPYTDILGIEVREGQSVEITDLDDETECGKVKRKHGNLFIELEVTWIWLSDIKPHHKLKVTDHGS